MNMMISYQELVRTFPSAVPEKQLLLRTIWIEEQEMGGNKIVMLAILVSFVAGCAPLHPSNCHKTTALGSCSSGRWDDQD